MRILWTTTLLTRLNGADRSKLSIKTGTNQKNAAFFLDNIKRNK